MLNPLCIPWVWELLFLSLLLLIDIDDSHASQYWSYWSSLKIIQIISHHFSARSRWNNVSTLNKADLIRSDFHIHVIYDMSLAGKYTQIGTRCSLYRDENKSRYSTVAFCSANYARWSKALRILLKPESPRAICQWALSGDPSRFQEQPSHTHCNHVVRWID